MKQPETDIIVSASDSVPVIVGISEDDSFMESISLAKGKNLTEALKQAQIQLRHLMLRVESILITES